MTYIELAAYDTLFTLLMLFAAGQTLYVMLSRMNDRRYGGTLLGDDVTRLCVGFTVMCMAVAIRIGGWLPWQLFMMADATEWAWYWTDHAWIFTGTGAILAGLGLSILFWDAVRRNRIAAGALVVTVIAGAVAFAFIT